MRSDRPRLPRYVVEYQVPKDSGKWFVYFRPPGGGKNTPMQAARSRAHVAAAMAGFAAQDINPVYGAGQPIGEVRPARKLVGNMVVAPPPEWVEIIDRICARHRVHRRDLLNGWRSVKAVACRNEVWATLRERFGTSYPKIGMMTGGFHHSTVMHGVRTHAASGAAQK